MQGFCIPAYDLQAEILQAISLILEQRFRIDLEQRYQAKHVVINVQMVHYIVVFQHLAEMAGASSGHAIVRFTDCQ